MSAFFKTGFTKELLEYESSLEQTFRFPIIGICAYDSHDLVDNLDLVQLNHIKQCLETFREFYDQHCPHLMI